MERTIWQGMSGVRSMKEKHNEGNIRKYDKEPGEADFSCFSTFRSESGGVRYGKCVADHHCDDCEVYSMFYEKAEEYYEDGNNWRISVALAKSFFGIPAVPEYDLETYQTSGSK